MPYSFISLQPERTIYCCVKYGSEVMLYYENNLLIQNDRAEMESANKL
jgi:hypothetical protein